MANFVVLNRHVGENDSHGKELLVNLDCVVSIRSYKYKTGTETVILSFSNGDTVDVKENFDDMKVLLEAVGVNYGRVSFLKNKKDSS